jgi:hypothetical protein
MLRHTALQTMQKKGKTDKEEMLARMDANMKTGQEQLQENLKRIIDEMMLITRKETMAC